MKIDKIWEIVLMFFGIIKNKSHLGNPTVHIPNLYAPSYPQLLCSPGDLKNVITTTFINILMLMNINGIRPTFPYILNKITASLDQVNTKSSKIRR